LSEKEIERIAHKKDVKEVLDPIKLTVTFIWRGEKCVKTEKLAKKIIHNVQVARSHTHAHPEIV
jgi:hypothetical protein